jgi:2-amino-4-hydroxy-6-hydroxymethyldihydropteridine diphosphokinase
MSPGQHRVCLLLGSNIRPERNLPAAVARLEEQLTILRVSSIWETPPVGSGGPDYLNAALLASTTLEADQLKKRVLRPLETRMGRVRSGDKNAPRTIDLDIILFDDRQLDPGLWQHAHRAVPVAEIVPEYESGQGEKLSAAAARLAAATPIRLRPDISVVLHKQAR